MQRYFITKEIREKVYAKFNGLCAYSGTKLEEDWQVDHVMPIHLIKKRNMVASTTAISRMANKMSNLMPTQKVINHYKGGLPLKKFKSWYLGGLHKRLARLPKNPLSYNSVKRKTYMLKIADYFGITPESPFCGELYFETLE